MWAIYDQGDDFCSLGCKTYEGLAAVWPTMSDDVGFAERINNLPKFVVSRSLRAPLMQ